MDSLATCDGTGDGRTPVEQNFRELPQIATNKKLEIHQE